jgi:phosphohistidine phosphatase
VRLHLIRHGDAHPSQVTWSGDDARPLSRKGHAEARRCGEALVRLGAEPDLVLSSPLVRARETAEDVCAALGTGLIPETTDVLAPGADPESLVSEIAIHHPGALEVVCTGHMPDLGYIAAWFATGTASRAFHLKTGSLVRADLDDRDVRLVWLLTPRVVKRLVAEK